MHIFKKIQKMNELARVASDGLISDVDYYIHTGSYMFNALLSGSIFRGFPGNKIVGFAGPPSAGKTILTLHIVRNFLKSNPNYVAIYFDTESALEKNTLLEMEMDLDRFLHVPIKRLEDFKNQAIQILDMAKQEQDKNPDRKIFFILDSLGMMASNKEIEDSIQDKNTSDMGLRAKLTKSIFRSLTMDLGVLQFPMIATTHTYDTMSAYSPSGIAGGKGLQFAGSIIIELIPSKDKDSASNVIGIIMRAVTRKSRLTKQYSQVKLQLNFSQGLNPYFGLLEFAEEHGIIKKDGKKYVINGNKFFKKEIYDDPKKFFTESVLKEIDVACKRVFMYSKDDDKFSNLDDSDFEIGADIDVSESDITDILDVEDENE